MKRISLAFTKKVNISKTMSLQNTHHWSEIASSRRDNKYKPASNQNIFSGSSSSSSIHMQTLLKCTQMFCFSTFFFLCSSLARRLQTESSGRYGGSGWTGSAGVPTASWAPRTDHLMEKGSRPYWRPRRAHHGKSSIQSQDNFSHVAFLTTRRTTGLPRYTHIYICIYPRLASCIHFARRAHRNH